MFKPSETIVRRKEHASSEKDFLESIILFGDDSSRRDFWAPNVKRWPSKGATFRVTCSTNQKARQTATQCPESISIETSHDRSATTFRELFARCLWCASLGKRDHPCRHRSMVRKASPRKTKLIKIYQNNQSLLFSCCVMEFAWSAAFLWNFPSFPSEKDRCLIVCDTLVILTQWLHASCTDQNCGTSTVWCNKTQTRDVTDHLTLKTPFVRWAVRHMQIQYRYSIDLCA